MPSRVTLLVTSKSQLLENLSFKLVCPPIRMTEFFFFFFFFVFCVCVSDNLLGDEFENHEDRVQLFCDNDQ
jgi:hypothetical protein